MIPLSLRPQVRELGVDLREVLDDAHNRAMKPHGLIHEFRVCSDTQRHDALRCVERKRSAR
jgi:hypothetical protein